MINNEVIESYLVCPYKAFFKFLGISGVDNVYIDYYKKIRLAIKDNVISHKFKNANVLDSKYNNIITELIDKTINLLKYFSYNIYVPIYSNGLKEIGKYFGLKWTDKKITGINSIVIRKEWETTKNEQLKNGLLRYNYEDCLNLYHVKQYMNLIRGRMRELPKPQCFIPRVMPFVFPV